MLNSNTCNHLTVCKQMINIRDVGVRYEYLKPLTVCKQMTDIK